jgi:hypothetical protein
MVRIAAQMMKYELKSSRSPGPIARRTRRIGSRTSGLDALLMRDTTLPLVTVVLAFPIGSADEPARAAGRTSRGRGLLHRCRGAHRRNPHRRFSRDPASSGLMHFCNVTRAEQARQTYGRRALSFKGVGTAPIDRQIIRMANAHAAIVALGPKVREHRSVACRLEIWRDTHDIATVCSEQGTDL